MLAAIDLWNPHTGLPIPAVLVTAFLLGMVHGVTPDEHTWPITFSYAIGAYSVRGGLIAGLTFSLAFTLQRAIASELAYLALGRWLENPTVEAWVYIAVGIAMFVAGRYIRTRGQVFHLHGLKAHHHHFEEPPALPPQMAFWHGLIAGWGFGAFALIIYTVLAPAMHSAWLAWMPGALFGLGTMVVQASVGALFGHWMRTIRLPEPLARRIARKTAGNTLFFGGVAFTIAGMLSLVFPRLSDFAIVTPLHIHNLHTLGLGFLLVMVTVLVVGIGTLGRSIEQAKRQLRP
ncbi:MAG: hypothetical protein M0Z53_02670 [Thermaerobacter sp.]|nr:hypothetical protein [Thermaerobacter sp.]